MVAQAKPLTESIRALRDGDGMGGWGVSGSTAGAKKAGAAQECPYCAPIGLIVQAAAGPRQQTVQALVQRVKRCFHG